MKILLVSNKIPFHAKNGGALAMLNVLKGIKHGGVETDVLSMNTSKHKLYGEEIKKEIPKDVGFHLVDLDTEIRVFDLISNLIFKKTPYILQRFVSDKFAKKLKELLTTNSYDIVQLEGLYLCPYIPTIRAFSKAKIAYRSHNVESVIWENNAKFEKNILKKAYLKSMAKRLLKYEASIVNQYDMLVAITYADHEFFKKTGNSRPGLTVPFGVDPSDYNPIGIKPVPATLFYIGSLDWIPNIEGLKWFVLNVWNVVRQNYPEVSFKVAGRNASNTLKEFFLKNGVDCLGEIEDSKAFFLENSIMIVPLFAGSGMRVKIIEGMAFGKTIVSTSKGAEGIDIGNGKHLIIADSDNEFVDSLLMLLANGEKCKNIGNNAKALINKQYNNKIITEQLVSFYKEMVQ